MKEISPEDYEVLISGGEILEKDKFGSKVYLLPENNICKLFRCKRTISSAKIYPYAQRFLDNSAKLAELGIPTVTVSEIYRAPHIERDIVVYPMLPGETLRKVLTETEDRIPLIEKFIDFIVDLHDKGVYFRSLHFGNVIVKPDGEFGLIDVSDMKISSGSLMMIKRVRNFKAIMRYTEDREFLAEFGFKRFFDHYIKTAKLSSGMFYAILKMQKKHPAVKILF